MLVWREIGSLLGSPIEYSVYLHYMMWRVLGGGVGPNSILSAQQEWTGYDLVQIEDYCMLGGGSKVLPWSVENGYLVGNIIQVGDNCYVGTNSTLRGGARLQDGATVAGCSVASMTVGGSETVVGVDIVASTLDSNHTRPVALFSKLNIASHLSGLLVWVFVGTIVAVTFGLDVFDSGPSSIEDVYLMLVSCMILGVTVALLLPLLGVVLCLVSKSLLIGSVEEQEINLDSYAMVPYWTYLDLFGRIRDNSILLSLGGTFLETGFYRALGATIGTNVFLDSVYFFEPDLVVIGDHTSIGLNTTLSPHQVTRTTMELANLHVGTRCTTGVNAVLHGRDLLKDDATLSGKSMALIGSRLSEGGTWSGYPARKTGPTSQPKKPALPVWYVMMSKPLCVLRGMFWWFVLAVEGCCCFRLRPVGNADVIKQDNFPTQIAGRYKATDLPMTLRLDVGSWTPNLRSLKLAANTYAEAENAFEGYAWCRWASYSLSFDDQCKEAEGRVSFGCWRVPKSIVCLRLRREGDDWVVGHSWFMGDPQKEYVFRESNGLE
mmetsp:Transcript_1240/g.1754  ORF Transcript_1240/g.1754 Transcript_1240/m.1754 type:complete len:547 (-) Transcript_1240:190-1830(-)